MTLLIDMTGKEKLMPTITFTQADGSEQTIEVADGTTLMRAGVSNGIAGIVGECGGQAMCATCHVYVRPAYLDSMPVVAEDEDEMLDCTAAARTERSRLGCQISVGEQLPIIVVDIPAEQI